MPLVLVFLPDQIEKTIIQFGIVGNKQVGDFAGRRDVNCSGG
jgi:hypothetical protein